MKTSQGPGLPAPSVSGSPSSCSEQAKQRQNRRRPAAASLPKLRHWRQGFGRAGVPEQRHGLSDTEGGEGVNDRG